jgi:hypothetical protein
MGKLAGKEKVTIHARFHKLIVIDNNGNFAITITHHAKPHQTNPINTINSLHAHACIQEKYLRSLILADPIRAIRSSTMISLLWM